MRLTPRPGGEGPSENGCHVDDGRFSAYALEAVDLTEFYLPEQIRKAKEGQRDYAKMRRPWYLSRFPS